MPPSQITIIRSKRRRKTIQTKYADGRLWIYLPFGMNPKEEEKWIKKMIERNEQWAKKKTFKKSDSWLMHRAQELNKKYFNGSLQFSIKFVLNQNTRYGSCTSVDRSIRISERVKTMPSWVQNYIIIHELAHLIYPDHSKKFWDKVHQYKYAERAIGYLIAIGAETIDGEQNSAEMENTSHGL